MVEHLEVLAVIPARGGSKGILRKNIRLFAGYPLISYSIAAALQSNSISRTIVSTDDEEIAAVARSFGAEVPFIRPAELAQDQTLDLPVFQHALNWLAENEHYYPQIIVQLRPTSPVRQLNCVDSAVQLLLSHPKSSSVRGVVSAGQNPYKMWRLDGDGATMKPLLKVEGIAEPYNAPRQALPSVYWQTGHIDAIRREVIMEQNSMSGDVITPLIIDSRFTVDIDNLSDWQRAEWLVVNGSLDMVFPGKKRRPLPHHIELVVFDFDGVMTDNRVWVNEDGKEMVAAYRSDSYGIRRLWDMGIKTVVLSSEVNTVVAARCKKFNVPVIQGVADKATVLKSYIDELKIDPSRVVYVGNDINDVPCFSVVGCAVVVEDAQPEALHQADLVLSRKGGHGAVREICERIINRSQDDKTSTDW